jgi:integrase
MKGSTYRTCSCRNPETGRKYPRGQCPRLNSKRREDQGHGAWWGTLDAPRGPDSKRRQIYLGPFEKEAEAEDAVAKEISRLRGGGHETDRQLKVAEYLTIWLDGKRGLKPDTWNSYEEAVRLYFIPALGHLRMCDLRDHHISDLVSVMGQINRALRNGEKHSELLRRLVEVRADDERRQLPEGEVRHKKSTRPLSPSRIKRIMAVLNSALNAAVRAKKLEVNPAQYVELPRIKKRKPLVWTKPRVERYLATGKVPGPVMVWTPKQTGAFLDFIAEERLYALYHLTAFRGLRRAEDVGLAWTELDLDEALLTVLVTLTDDQYDDPVDDDYDDPEDPKSDAGSRTMSLDPLTVSVLENWRGHQEQERAEAGASWTDSGKVFTQPDGSPLRPAWISERFDGLIEKYNTIRRGFKDGKTIEQLAKRHRVSKAAVEVALTESLPPIRFHDLRHGAATLSLAAGVEMKVVSEVLGHSKSSFTSDVYTSVIPEVHKAAAEAVAAMVPLSRSTERASRRLGLDRPSGSMRRQPSRSDSPRSGRG